MRARIRNKRINGVICASADVLANALSKGIGLMARTRTNGALFRLNSESRVNASIHMFLMLIPIDVVWMDMNGVVVDVMRNIKPFSLFDARTWKTYVPKKKAAFILELETGMAKDIKIGDALSIEYID